MALRNYSFLMMSLLVLCLLFSCKKNKDVVMQADSSPVEDKLKDTVVLNSKDIYLWYNQIPSTFNGRNFADPNAVMEAIRQYSIEPGFTEPVDRWSFAVKQTEWNDISSGIGGDFGLGAHFIIDGDLRVKYVENGSAANIAGIHRGWRITKVDGSTNINYANADALSSKIFSSNQTNFTFQKPDGSSVDITLNATAYNEDPVYLDSVYTINSKKIGYLVFNSFLGDTTAIYNRLQQVFNYFFNENISDVIVDLRYNGGGYVSVQEKLANYLAPSSANGQFMMKQQYNDKYTQYNTSVNFSKKGSLNLSRIFFIVTNGTASASELLINNLKPYMEEKLVGPTPTHGKPVGFFPIPVADWYIFPVSFRSTNKNNEGNYFKGIPVNSQIADGLDKDWGDTRETSLASALKYITTGTFSAQTNGPAFNQAQKLKSNSTLDRFSFKGTVGVKIPFEIINH
jgi:carboxyl-terminal processing protease